MDLTILIYRTVASALNSLSAVTYEDIFVTGMNIKINPEKAALYIKWMSLGYVNSSDFFWTKAFPKALKHSYVWCGNKSIF